MLPLKKFTLIQETGHQILKAHPILRLNYLLLFNFIKIQFSSLLMFVFQMFGKQLKPTLLIDCICIIEDHQLHKLTHLVKHLL